MAESSGRIERLRAMLDKSPDDAFLLYSMGMEHKNARDTARAVEFFDRALAADPGYCYAYYQKGQTFEGIGEVEGARRAYRDGLAAAARTGDDHARGEIQGALDLLG